MLENNRNTLSKILFFLGIGIIIFAVFFGIFHSASDSYDNTVNWSVALPIWVAGIVSGLVFLGFSEVIRLLQDIRDGIVNDSIDEKKEEHKEN